MRVTDVTITRAEAHALFATDYGLDLERGAATGLFRL